jgi:hypothetical protein
VFKLLKPGKFFCLNVGSQKYPLKDDAIEIAQRIGFAVDSVDDSFIDGLGMGDADNASNGEVLITFRKQI